jgi:hypothetical protein
MLAPFVSKDIGNELIAPKQLWLEFVDASTRFGADLLHATRIDAAALRLGVFTTRAISLACQ